MAHQCITKEMLHLNVLEKLRRDRHKAGLTFLLQNENWHIDARRCIEVKLTEWALQSGLAAENDEGMKIKQKK